MPQPKDKDWINGYKNKTPIYAVYKRPTTKQGTQQTESEGLEKDISCKRRPEEIRTSNDSYQIKTLK